MIEVVANVVLWKLQYLLHYNNLILIKQFGYSVLISFAGNVKLLSLKEYSPINIISGPVWLFQGPINQWHRSNVVLLFSIKTKAHFSTLVFPFRQCWILLSLSNHQNLLQTSTNNKDRKLSLTPISLCTLNILIVLSSFP